VPLCCRPDELRTDLLSSRQNRRGQRFWIPVFLALSNGISLVLGKLFDRLGLPIVLISVFLSAGFSPLVFFGDFRLALVGILLWGIGYATQDTLLKALVATVLPEAQRNFAFGLYYGGYGVGWLIGSVGLLYDQSRLALVTFAVAAQLLALPIFALAPRLRS
jgi:hypothetical protein